MTTNHVSLQVSRICHVLRFFSTVVSSDSCFVCWDIIIVSRLTDVISTAAKHWTNTPLLKLNLMHRICKYQCLFVLLCRRFGLPLCALETVSSSFEPRCELVRLPFCLFQRRIKSDNYTSVWRRTCVQPNEKIYCIESSIPLIFVQTGIFCYFCELLSRSIVYKVKSGL